MKLDNSKLYHTGIETLLAVFSSSQVYDSKLYHTGIETGYTSFSRSGFHKL